MSFLVTPIFGTGIDGDVVLSSNTVDAPIDSAFSGLTGATTGSATNASFATGQAVLIHQTKGTNAGVWERNVITGYSSGTITLGIPLSSTYTSGAQILVLKQYRSLTINSGVTLSVKPYDGTVGGILSYLVSGSLINNGIITGTGRGFRGGSTGSAGIGQNGEGTGGNQTNTRNNNGNGGGGGGDFEGSTPAGGGNATAASNGNGNALTAGFGGNDAGSVDLTIISLGGGGGASTTTAGTVNGGTGGAMMVLYVAIFINNGSIPNNGTDGATSHITVASAPAAGGSTLVFTIRAMLGSGTMTALPGAPGTGSVYSSPSASVGRIAIAKCRIDDAGTTNPTFYDKGYQTYCGMVGRG